MFGVKKSICPMLTKKFCYSRTNGHTSLGMLCIDMYVKRPVLTEFYFSFHCIQNESIIFVTN